MDKAAIRQFFDENGYYVARGVFSSAQVAALEEDFDRIVSQLQRSGEEINARWGGEEMKRLDGGQSAIFHTHNVQCYSARWLQAVMDPNFLDVAEAIIGPDIILHHTKLFQKPSEKGSPFPMHQDWTYFPSIKDTMIAGIIHVSRATDEMGCLRVYPGSHKLGRIEGTNGQADSEELAKYPIEGATPLEAEPGDVAFFHYFTLHGSLPNRSQEVRKTVLAQLHSGEDAIETRGAGHPNARLVLRGWNHAATRSNAMHGK
jgi:ectoine hydroxylase-related dioxygenase (phytanoyl-CoA dioxygenase family)